MSDLRGILTVEDNPEHALKELNNTLEERVVERTAQLTSVNETLRTEIAELKRDREALCENEDAKFSLLFENNLDAVFLTFPDGRILSANPAACQMFGMTEEEIIRVGRAGLSPPDDPKLVAALVERKKTGQVGAVELDYIRKNGQRFPAEVDSVILPGEPLRSFVIMRDITARKQAIEELRQSEERYRTLFNTMNEGFCIIEMLFDTENHPIDYRFLNTNPAFETQTGVRNVQGKLMSELSSPERAENWSEFYGKVALTGEPVRFVNEAKILSRWFDVSAYRVDGPDSRKVAILFNDITETKRAEAVLKNSNENLEKRVAQRTGELADTINNLRIEIVERERAVETVREKEQLLIQQSRQAAMGEMIGNIAHQWRQPLNTLGLLSQQLLLYYDMGEFDRTFLVENVDKEMELIQHMSKTIDDFRNYFKPDKERIDFKVKEAVTSTLSLLEGSLQNPQINVEIVEKDDPIIHGYPNEFAQVLLNLVVNAKDVFTERKIVDPTLMITVSSEDSCVVVTIADNAGGINEEIIDKIFEPYFTTKGPQGGTGIGLFMSKTIIEKNMGGRLTVRNIRDGAEFRIEIKDEQCFETN